MSVDIATLGLEVRSDGVVVASDRLRTLTQEGGRAEQTANTLASSFSNVTKYLQAAASALAAWKLTQYIQEATLLAARVETLGVVLNVVTKNFNYSQMQMKGFVEGLKKTGISTQEATSNMVKMAQAGLDLTKSSQLARVAQDAAVIGNINSSEAFARMIQGIRSGETEILRNIGLNINMEQANKKYAESLGKKSAALTESEKIQARANAVMEEGTKIAGSYEASMNTAGKMMNSFARLFEELKLVVGQQFMTPFTEGVKAVTEALKWANAHIQDMVIVAKTLGGVFAGFAVVAGAVAGFNALSAAIVGCTAAMRAAAITSAFVGPLTAATIAANQAASAATLFGRALSLMGGPLGIVIGLLTAATAGFVAYLKAKGDALDSTMKSDVGSEAFLLAQENIQIKEQIRLLGLSAAAKKEEANAALEAKIKKLKTREVELQTQVQSGDGSIYGGTFDRNEKQDKAQQELNTVQAEILSLASLTKARDESAATLAKLREAKKKGNIADSGAIEKEIDLYNRFVDAFNDKIESMDLSDPTLTKHQQAMEKLRIEQEKMIKTYPKEKASIIELYDWLRVETQVRQENADLMEREGKEDNADNWAKMFKAAGESMEKFYKDYNAAQALEIENTLAQIDTQEKFYKITTGDAATQRIVLLEQARQIAQESYELETATTPEAELKRLQLKKDIIGYNAKILDQQKLLYDQTAWGGMTNAIQNYGKEAANIGKQVENTFTNAFKNMEDALVKFCMTGKMDFKSMANSIISDIVRIAVKQAIVNGISGGKSGVSLVGTGLQYLASSGATQTASGTGPTLVNAGAGTLAGQAGSYLGGTYGAAAGTSAFSAGSATGMATAGTYGTAAAANTSIYGSMASGAVGGSTTAVTGGTTAAAGGMSMTGYGAILVGIIASIKSMVTMFEGSNKRWDNLSKRSQATYWLNPALQGLDGLFGGRVFGGKQTGGFTLSAADGQISGQNWKRTSGGWFDHTKFEYKELDKQWSDFVQMQYKSIGDALKAGASALGMDKTYVNAVLGSFNMDEIKVTLSGDAANQQKQIKEAYRKVSNEMLSALNPEGYGYTKDIYRTETYNATAGQYEQIYNASTEVWESVEIYTEATRQVKTGTEEVAGSLVRLGEDATAAFERIQATRQADTTLLMQELELKGLKGNAEYTALLNEKREIELLTMEESTQAIQRRVWKLQDEQEALAAYNDALEGLASAQAAYDKAFGRDLDSIADNLTSAAEELKDVVLEQVDAQMSVLNAYKEIKFGASAQLSPEAAYNYAKTNFATATGADLPEAATALMEASKNYNATGAAFFADQEMVLSRLGSEVSLGADTSLEALNTQINVLRYIKTEIQKNNQTTTLSSNFTNSLVMNSTQTQINRLNDLKTQVGTGNSQVTSLIDTTIAGLTNIQNTHGQQGASLAGLDADIATQIANIASLNGLVGGGFQTITTGIQNELSALGGLTNLISTGDGTIAGLISNLNSVSSDWFANLQGSISGVNSSTAGLISNLGIQTTTGFSNILALISSWRTTNASAITATNSATTANTIQTQTDATKDLNSANQLVTTTSNNLSPSYFSVTSAPTLPPVPQEVTLWDGPNLSGKSFRSGEASIPNARTTGLGNDNIQSITIPEGSRLRAVLYEHENYGGASSVCGGTRTNIGKWVSSLKIEKYATGGLASGWAMVGEEGPELVNFSDPGRVYTANQTRVMTNGSADNRGVEERLDRVIGKLDSMDRRLGNVEEKARLTANSPMANRKAA